MAKLYVVALDARLPRWALEARDEYLRRLPRGYAVECLALKSSASKALHTRLPQGARLVALDERGRDLSTAQLARQLARWRAEGAPIAFVIGGPDGLTAEVTQRAALVLRLSSFTLPHALAQVLLCEQLYRVAMLATGHPYHRA